jgi:parallel beta-helix repeat protein
MEPLNRHKTRKIRAELARWTSQWQSSNFRPRASPLFAALLIFVAAVHANVFYVKPTGVDGNSGLSWALAKRSITNALAATTAGDQVWVASGVYTQLVTLPAAVALYGGFSGTETTLAQRNWITNLSVIYGPSAGTTPALSINDGGPDTRVDGMAITAGHGVFGGGISCVSAGPVIANNFVFRNTADGAGGGIYIFGFLPLTGAQPIVTNNTVYQNLALGGNGSGAGIAVRGASPLIALNRVLDNLAAGNAGGIGCWKNCQGVIVNNIIEGNAASVESGNIAIGGGILASARDIDGTVVQNAISSPVIANNLIAANGAESGGGIALADAESGAANVVNNTIVANTGSGFYWGNTSPTNVNNLIAFNSTGLERVDSSPITLQNCDVYGNSVMASNTDYVGFPNATGSYGNISGDPSFANFSIGDFHLEPGSPCVDAGLTAAVLAGVPDIDGNARVQGLAVDIGAIESSGAVVNVPTPVIHVSPGGNDANDGLTWATAKRTVQGGISAAAAGIIEGGEVWVAQGTYAEHIAVPAFVYLYGGFTGTETSRAQRNFSAYPTILDGGGVHTVVLSQSAGYLVSALDGFIVQKGGVFTGGQIPGASAVAALGGGINCTVSAPIIANNLIRSNSIGNPFSNASESSGAGIYGYLAHARIIGNTIMRNENIDKVAGSGGGAYFLRSKPTIEQNVFRENHAKYGQAIFSNIGSARIVQNVIQTNWMYADGTLYMGGINGAVYIDGCQSFLIEGNLIEGNWADFGAGIDVDASQPGRIQNNLLLGNLAEDIQSGIGWGGGLFCGVLGGPGPGNVVVVNNTIVGNSSPGPLGSDQGGGISLDLVTNTMVLANNIVAFNSGGIYLYPSQVGPVVYANNCVTNPINYTLIAPGTGDLHLDPQFTNRAAGDFHLLASSPCIDAGIASNAPVSDKDGIPRPLDGNNDGLAAFDIGAFEFVNPTADTDHDGMPDWAELIAGTSPTDLNSVLKLRASRLVAGNAIALNWLSVTGRTYSVQFAPTVGSGWQLFSNNIPGTGAMLEVHDPLAVGSSNRLYRLGVVKN